MNDINRVDSVPNQRKRGPKKTPYREVCIKLYLTNEEFQTYANEAVKAGKRSKSLKLFTQKPHGFADEVIPNCKGIAKFIRESAIPSWLRTETERLIKRKALEKDAIELGMTLQD